MLERMMGLNGSVTHFYGRAFTGQGVKNLYSELIEEAEQVYFIKCPPTFHLSDLLKEVGYHYLKKGFDIQWFYDPLFHNCVEATYVKGPNILFVQASYPTPLEPEFFGSGHIPVSLYDCFDENRLKEDGGFVRDKLEQGKVWLDKCLNSLKKGKLLHDDWEDVTQACMNWDALNEQASEVKSELFRTLHLSKKPKEFHRLIGTLTPMGAKDYVPSITKDIQYRIFIKGLPGTGKSTLMKQIGKEALDRGLDVQYLWCGLDANSIDMVLIPELQMCIFDSTAPHVYEPERDGDEILDVAVHCKLTDAAHAKIADIKSQYEEHMQDAVGHLHNYGHCMRIVKEKMDAALNETLWAEKTKQFFQNVEVLKKS